MKEDDSLQVDPLRAARRSLKIQLQEQEKQGQPLKEVLKSIVDQRTTKHNNQYCLHFSSTLNKHGRPINTSKRTVKFPNHLNKDLMHGILSGKEEKNTAGK